MRSGQTESSVLPEYRLGNRTPHMRALGYFFRCVLVFLCSYGCVRTVFDSVGAPLPVGILLISCLVFCAVFCLAALSAKTAVVCAVATVAGTLTVFSFAGGVTKVVLAMGGALVNAWCSRLDTLGYSVPNIDELIADAFREIGRTQEEMYIWGAVFAALIVCAVITAFGARKVRLIPLLLAVLSASVYFVIYGACTRNTGPALTTAAVTAMSAEFYYENLFSNKRVLREALGTDASSLSAKRELAHAVRVSSELGGFYGMAAALVMLILIAVPVGIGGAMKDIPAVSRIIHRSADVVMTMADGYLPDADGFLYIGRENLNSRNTEASPRELGGDAVLSVSTDVNVPIYLRGWTGVDYIGDSWNSVSYSRMSEYRKTFGKGFSAELLTNELLHAVDPLLTELPDGSQYVSHGDFGYVIAPVHIQRLENAQKDMLLPSYTDPQVNLLRYGTNISHSAGYGSYYEGIFTSHGLSAKDSYSVKAHLALPPTPEILMNISFLVRHYNSQREVVSAIRTLLSRGADEEDIQNEYLILMANKPTEGQETTQSGHYVFPSGWDALAYRYVYEMTATERGRIDALIDSMDSYNNYVYENYITVCENYEAFDALANKIISDSGTSVAYTYPGRHRMVEAVINYLSSNMTYTLTPSEPSADRPYYNSADTFLFDTGEGYCVQYATSAVMLLRCLGIPARYASGYIANSFEPSSSDAPGAYTASVTEDEAHAWIEVYYDYYGWIQYEATAPFVADVEVTPAIRDEQAGEQTTAPPADEAPEKPAQTQPHQVPPLPTPVDGVADHRINTAWTTVIAVVTAVLVMAAASIAVILIIRRGKIAQAKLADMISKGRGGKLTLEQRLEAAEYLEEVIMKLLGFRGLNPENSERPSCFFGRSDEKLSRQIGVSFTKVGGIIQACEFGGQVTEAELSLLSDCAEALYLNTVKTCGAIMAVYVKYFLIVA